MLSSTTPRLFTVKDGMTGWPETDTVSSFVVCCWRLGVNTMASDLAGFRHSELWSSQVWTALRHSSRDASWRLYRVVCCYVNLSIVHVLHIIQSKLTDYGWQWWNVKCKKKRSQWRPLWNSNINSENCRIWLPIPDKRLTSMKIWLYPIWSSVSYPECAV